MKATTIRSTIVLAALVTITGAAVIKDRAAHHRRRVPLNRHSKALFSHHDSEAGGSASEEQYENRAFPGDEIAPAQVVGSYTAFLSVQKLPGGKHNNWQQVGPITPFVVDSATY